MTRPWNPKRWLSAEEYRGLSHAEQRALFNARRGKRLGATTIGAVMAAAVIAGLAVGMGWSEQPPASAPDQAILWDETQRPPSAEVAAEDRSWASRGNEAGSGGALRRAQDERSGGAGVRLRFGACQWGGGTNCVVDGDTIYLGGRKIRIAGIDAPETHEYGCPAELERGMRAAERLRAMLNAGPVTLTAIDRDEDRYGRKLRNVAVGGADVGQALIGEGLARAYGGGRRGWC